MVLHPRKAGEIAWLTRPLKLDKASGIAYTDTRMIAKMGIPGKVYFSQIFGPKLQRVVRLHKEICEKSTFFPTQPRLPIVLVYSQLTRTVDR